MDVRALPVAPAAMQPHAVAWDALQRFVERGHVQLAGLHELRVGLVLERHGALHRQIRRVDLQDQARLVDGLILGPHLAGERHQIGFVAVVVGVHHSGGDDAGRGRGREHLGERRLGRGRTPLEARDLVLDVLGVEVAHLGDRLRRVGDLGSPGEAPQELLDQLGHLLEVLADLALGFPAEARHARGDVGLEADALLLAVVADVDAGGDLGLDHAAHGPIHLRRHGGAGDRLAGLAPDQQVGQHLVARQAADMRRQDSIAAVEHGHFPWWVLVSGKCTGRHAIGDRSRSA